MLSQVKCGDLKILNADGLAELIGAFNIRIRQKASFPDFADAYLRGLQAAGALEEYLLPGVDPFTVIRNVVEHGADRAVAMQRESFRWPSTAAPVGSGYLNDASWPEIGLLRHLGYHVGKAGKSRMERRRILDLTYRNTVPRVESAKHMQEWGKPQSGVRLKKMADCIAAFVRNAKRRNGVAMSTAVADWEADLGYLKQAYYVGRYDFPWPDTSIRKRA